MLMCYSLIHIFKSYSEMTEHIFPVTLVHIFSVTLVHSLNDIVAYVQMWKDVLLLCFILFNRVNLQR